MSLPRHSATPPGSVSGTDGRLRDERALPAATSRRSCGSSPRIASWTIAGPALTVVRESVKRNSVASTSTRDGARLRGRGERERASGERAHLSITGLPMPRASGRTAAGSTPNQSPHSAP